MASLFISTVPLHHQHSTTSSLPSLTASSNSSCALTCSLPRTTRTQYFSNSTTFGQTKSCTRRGYISNSALHEVSVIYPSETEKSKSELIGSLKFKLMNAVYRGFAVSADDSWKAENAAKELESVGGPVDLLVDIDKLQGRWKLIYSSAFSSPALGRSRPGTTTGGLLPITLGQEFQRIDILSKDIDNIVELQLGTPWPFPAVEVTATLAHKFEILGTSNIKMTFDKTTLKTNLSQLPPLDVPWIPDSLRPFPNPGSCEFQVTYLDSDTRITRGDMGELRVFVIS